MGIGLGMLIIAGFIVLAFVGGLVALVAGTAHQGRPLDKAKREGVTGPPRDPAHQKQLRGYDRP